MAKYIECEALLKSDNWQNLKSDFDKARAHIIILGQPAADVVEVVHGEWIEIDNIVIENGMLTVKGTTWRCNVCGEARKTLTKPNMNYCPNCGARMDGKGIDNG